MDFGRTRITFLASAQTRRTLPEPARTAGAQRARSNENTDQLGRLADKATDQARNVAQYVEEFANNAAQQGRPAGERTQEVDGNVKGAVDMSIKGSADCDFGCRRGAGFVLGALWKS